MKRYSPLVLVMFFIVGCSSSPSCDTSQTSSQWHNCSGMDIEKGNGTYIGEYKHGVRHGKGEFEFISEDKYVGEFKNNKFDGQGTYIFSSGFKYIGEHKDGKPHGQGTYTHEHGEVLKGIWENGEFMGVNYRVGIEDQLLKITKIRAEPYSKDQQDRLKSAEYMLEQMRNPKKSKPFTYK